MLPKKAKLIVFESGDATGKSTQARMLANYLRARAIPSKLVKMPYGEGPLKKLIYWSLRNGLARKFPNLFQIIHFLNKLFFQRYVLKRMVNNYDCIIFDRWKLSLWAYGVGDGASTKMTKWMLTKLAEPDLTIILDGEPFARRYRDTIEADNIYQRKIRELYLNWAAQNKCCVQIINAEQELYNVHSTIVKNVNNNLNNVKKETSL